MPTLSVARVKQALDARESVKANLLREFAKFRDAFIERLSQFTAEAVKEGLPGVTPCKEMKAEPTVRMVSVTLRGFVLTLVAGNIAFRNKGQYQAKVLIYEGSDGDSTPVIEAVAGELASQLYYGMDCVSGGTRESIVALSLDKDGAKRGREIADAFIEYCYGLDTAWPGRPTLEWVLTTVQKEKPAWKEQGSQTPSS